MLVKLVLVVVQVMVVDEIVMVVEVVETEWVEIWQVEVAREIMVVLVEERRRKDDSQPQLTGKKGKR